MNGDHDWRNHCYMYDLDQIIAIIAGYGRQDQNVACPSLPKGPPNAILSRDLCERNSLFSQSVSPSASTPAPPALHNLPPVGFGASARENHPGNISPNVWMMSHQDLRAVDTATCSVTSSDFLSDESPSPSQSTSEPSSPTTESSTRCPFCPRVFKGDPANQRRNLRRHIFGAHSIDPRISCPEPTCNKTFVAGRSDNRKRHMLNQHGRRI